MNSLFGLALFAEWKAALAFMVPATASVVLLAQAGGAWVTLNAGYDDVQPQSSEPQEHGLVELCHQPGTPAAQTMQVEPSALEGHLGHGDTMGACADEGAAVREERAEAREEERAEAQEAREEARAEAQAAREEARGERAAEREEARQEREQERGGAPAGGGGPPPAGGGRR